MKLLRSPLSTVLTVFAFLVVVGGLLFVLDIPRPVTSGPILPPTDPNEIMKATPFVMPGMTRPKTIPANQATLKDDEEIIGVIVNKKARAYRVRSLAGVSSHVLNDVIADVPVSVTYCDQTDCVRLFTSEGTEPLDIKTGGFNKGMLLLAEGTFYNQHNRQPLYNDAPLFPYDAKEFERTTWGQWRKAHPDTDVYEGEPEKK